MHRIFYFLFFMTLSANVLLGATNEDCLQCHMDKDLIMQKNGKKVSLYVNQDRFHKGPHGKLNCTSCHVGFNPYKTPHKEKITYPDCRTCHNDLKESHYFHPSIWKNEKSESSTCSNCHEGHHYVVPVKSAEFKFSEGKLNAGCGNCHGSQTRMVAQSGHRSRGAGSMNCLTCHSLIKEGIQPASQAVVKERQNGYCTKCHIENEAGKGWGKVLNPEKSIHGAHILKGDGDYPSCVECHGVHEAGGETALSKTNSKKIFNVCGKCHVNITTAFHSSTHGLAVEDGNKDAPSCKHCHLEHNFKKNIVKGKDEQIRMRNSYCFGCHQDKALSQRNELKTLSEGHTWLSQAELHLEKVDCAECHSSTRTGGQAHDILMRDNAIRECSQCHSGNTNMISSLMLEEKKRQQGESGFWASIFDGDSYIKGTSRNLLAETISWILFILFIAALSIHALIRLYFSRSIRKEKREEA